MLEFMPDDLQCRALAKKYKDDARHTGISKDRAFIMNNIARSLMGLATQLDMLEAKIREEQGSACRKPCGQTVAQYPKASR